MKKNLRCTEKMNENKLNLAEYIEVSRSINQYNKDTFPAYFKGALFLPVEKTQEQDRSHHNSQCYDKGLNTGNRMQVFFTQKRLAHRHLLSILFFKRNIFACRNVFCLIYRTVLHCGPMIKNGQSTMTVNLKSNRDN